MSRIHPERHDSDAFDRSLAVDVLLRQEPDEEEEEDEGDGKQNDDDDDDGYSERAFPYLCRWVKYEARTFRQGSWGGA